MAVDSSDTAVGEALRFVQMSGVFYCPSELTEPWGLELPPMADCVWFHAMIEGEGSIEVEGERHRLGPGDLVLVPHGTGHRCWGLDDAAPTPSVYDLPHQYHNDRFAVLRHGGSGGLTRVVCGGIRLGHPAARHLIDALPPFIRIESGRSARTDWMRATIELMGEETREVRPGAEAVISRLCDIVVIQALRSWIEHAPEARTGWLGALRDEQIGRAIGCMHAQPDRDWTVAQLADEVSMSRSAFSARFTELVGEPVARYLTRWRMQVALELLRTTDLTVAATARQVGYDSEAAFSRAFKRVVGMSPRAARRTPEPEPVPAAG